MREIFETAGIMKNAFIPSTSLKSRSGTLCIIPLIFMSALARFAGLPVITAEPRSAAKLAVP